MKIIKPDSYIYTTTRHFGAGLNKIVEMRVDQNGHLTFFSTFEAITLNYNTPQAHKLEVQWRSDSNGWQAFLPWQDQPFTSVGRPEWLPDKSSHECIVRRLQAHLEKHPGLEATLCRRK